MKRKISSIFICLAFLVVFSVTAFADNRVTNIDISVLLNEDGSMNISQVWKGKFTEGTENYFHMNASDDLTISDLVVSDAKGTYQALDKWDVDSSFAEKARKSGINYTNDGYEICFGISDYGDNRYEIEYKLDNVVSAYTDLDGVNFRFVNDQMNTTPTNVTVIIRLADGTPITDDIADIWGFGFDGAVNLSDDGAIKAYTNKPISGYDHVTVMFSLEKGILSPTRTENTSFEYVKKLALKGSDYDYDNKDSDYDNKGGDYDNSVSNAVSDLMDTVKTILWFVSPIIILIAIELISHSINKKKLAQFAEKFGYYRDIPNDKNMNATYALARLFDLCKDETILGTSMLRLIDFGALVPIVEEEAGFMGKTKENVNLQMLGSNHSNMTEFDIEFYNILVKAAGEDGVLQAKELERFAGQNDKIIRAYMEKCMVTGKNYLINKKCFTSLKASAKLKYLTPQGQQELGEVTGFKKYLEDFSLIAERGIKEIPIWKEILSYAMLFGIADKLAEQMKALYPNILPEIETYTRTIVTARSYNYILYHNMRAAESRRQQQSRSSGSGGRSSRGGGGGSRGGGSRGGSR